MKQKFSKRIIACIMAFVICVAVAGFSFALPASGIQTRNITVDTSKVLQSVYQGVGDNLWTGPYTYGMNDAYQLVNDARTNAVQPAWMRMMFLPQWIVYLDETPEVQKQRWEAGDYNWSSVEFKNFMIKVKGLLASGCVIQFNMGGRVDVSHGMTSWFSIKDASVSAAGSRGAPANIEAFAAATVAVVQKILEASNTYGIEGVNKDKCYLSFYNEVNNSAFEAFGDKRVYWCTMIKKVHYALKDAQIRSKVQICGTEISRGFVELETGRLVARYVAEKLVDESNNPIYDYLCNHIYMHQYRYDSLLSDMIKGKGYIDELNLPYPQADKLRSTEGAAGEPVADADPYYNFGVNDVSLAIANANSGYDGCGSWGFYGELIPEPINVPQTSLKRVNVGLSFFGT